MTPTCFNTPDGIDYALAQSDGVEFCYLSKIDRLGSACILAKAKAIAGTDYSGAVTLDCTGIVPEVRYAADGEYQAMTIYVVPANDCR